MTPSLPSESHSVSTGRLAGPIQLVTLDPGHFHAALVQKKDLNEVDPRVHVYAPEGPDLDLHLQRIESFNHRQENPTRWESVVYTGDDYLHRMLQEKTGNVMITAGNNRKKSRYILESVRHGFHVLADKPMIIDKSGWKLLVEAFKEAGRQGVLLYDIMTERHELTSRVLRSLMREKDLFGELLRGSKEHPAIYKESVHHLYKQVSGAPLRRPSWYFDIHQQGEGIVDVTVHLIDLSMWIAFPERAFYYDRDVELLDAERWPTIVSAEQFERVTDRPYFPSYLSEEIDKDGKLHLYCNGKLDYTLDGHHARVNVIWDYEAPPGGGDRQATVIRGTHSKLVVRQGKDQDFVATVYVEPEEGASPGKLRGALDQTIDRLQEEFPGAGYEQAGLGWKLNIPDRFYFGHEAHFAMVAESFFEYLKKGELPEWEVPNMITRYYLTAHARERALQKQA